jgi:hypothetical protein
MGGMPRPEDLHMPTLQRRKPTTGRPMKATSPPGFAPWPGSFRASLCPQSKPPAPAFSATARPAWQS